VLRIMRVAILSVGTHSVVMLCALLPIIVAPIGRLLNVTLNNTVKPTTMSSYPALAF
jgi:hypothetical protein